MARRKSRRSQNSNATDEDRPVDPPLEDGQQHRLPAAVRQRHRAVAEREASRLVRPERRTECKLGHANRSKSAVASTPFGYHAKSSSSPTDKQSSKTAAEEDEGWCGPFSVARQMIAKREDARRKREAEQLEESKVHHPLDDMMVEVEMEQKRKAHPSLQWRGQVPSSSENNNQSYYAKRQKRAQTKTKEDGVPSLFQLCVDFLVQNFEHVEALGDVDNSIRRSISEALVAKKKMDGAAFDVVAETGIEALELVDCAEVIQDQLSKSLKALIPAGLRFLLLNHAGRCFGPKAVEAIVSSTNSSLFAISIGGAYLLKDADAASLIDSTAPTLSSIEFKACPLLGNDLCTSLSHNFSSSTGKGCLLELSLEYLVLTKENLLAIASTTDALRNLKSLTLRQIGSVDDEVILQLLGAVGDSLESIDLSLNHSLTDDVLSGIRKSNKSGALRSLQLSALKNLTAAGLEALFTFGIPGLPSPPMLRKLDVSSCDYDSVTDEVFDLVTKASSLKRGGEGTVASSWENQSGQSLSSMGGLVYVNINGSSCTDKSMESLAATSASSLKELDVSFCPKITDQGLGYLVSRAGHQLVKLHIWGCAQLTDEFLDGHSRVEDCGFEIVGAWMKKAGGRSLR